MMKLVLKLELHDDKAKKKVMRTVSGFPGVESISMEQKDQKLTVTGDVDPVIIVAKLRKFCHTDLITAGPAKEPEKKKQEPAKKPEDNTTKDIIMPGFYNHHPHMMPSFYVRSYEEDPTNGCVIC